MFQAANLPGSHLGLDCDQILASPFPVRHGVVENTVGLGTGPPGGIRACMLTALELIRECLSSDWLLDFALPITCALVIVIWSIYWGIIHSTMTGETGYTPQGSQEPPYLDNEAPACQGRVHEPEKQMWGGGFASGLSGSAKWSGNCSGEKHQVRWRCVILSHSRPWKVGERDVEAKGSREKWFVGLKWKEGQFHEAEGLRLAARVLACAHIYTGMGQYVRAVDLALAHDEVELASIIADRPAASNPPPRKTVAGGRQEGNRAARRREHQNRHRVYS